MNLYQNFNTKSQKLLKENYLQPVTQKSLTNQLLSK